MPDNIKKAIFAGGCFWCMEAAFEEEAGVIEVISGYIGGSEKDADYSLVSTGTTSHYEAVEVSYDPTKVNYEQLLDLFWRQIDPTDDGGQFADRGPQYRTAIFYNDSEEKEKAIASKEALEKSDKFDKPIVTQILEAETFYPAEEYHQDYYKKKTLQYQAYAKGSGRKDYIEETWGDEYLGEKQKLSKLQYDVTQTCSTEPAFDNEYWDNKEDGIYVDVVSGEVLFSSKDKFDSGTGWPSFTKPIGEIVEKQDNSLGMQRIEVKSKDANSHLGHVFNDGPNGSLRYCINSASLKFISKDKLAEEGYGEWIGEFE